MFHSSVMPLFLQSLQPSIWDLWLRIAKSANRIIGLPDITCIYRVHGGGIHHQLARMFIGKLNVYQKYDQDIAVPRLVRLRQYRYVYRELLNYLYAEKRFDEVKQYMIDFYRRDRLNPSTLKQRLLFAILPMKSFMWISNKIIYRIGYRLEYLTYLVFIPKEYRS